MHRATGAQQFAVGTDIVSVLGVPDEVGAFEDAILAIALLPYGDVRRDLLLLDQPTQELAGARRPCRRRGASV